MNVMTFVHQISMDLLQRAVDSSGFFSWGKRCSYSQTKKTNAGVFLVGAGTGDPELLTVKAARILADADVVLYDNLVSNSVLQLCGSRARKIYVGKRAGQHAMPQAQINQLLVEYGRESLFQSHVVVRLKGGDPAIFGRVTEEASSLKEANIPFAIVPGITSASAASAYTGIPLTARGISTSVRFFTAQFAEQNKQPFWDNYAYCPENSCTLVVYMGLNRLEELCNGLQSVGWPSTTPIALLDRVSSPDQQELRANISTIVEVYRRHQMGPRQMTGPTLIIIGDVIENPMGIDVNLLSPNCVSLPLTYHS